MSNNSIRETFVGHKLAKFLNLIFYSFSHFNGILRDTPCSWKKHILSHFPIYQIKDYTRTVDDFADCKKDIFMEIFLDDKSVSENFLRDLIKMFEIKIIEN